MIFSFRNSQVKCIPLLGFSIVLILLFSYGGLQAQYVQADVSAVAPSGKSNVSKALSVEPSTITSLSSSTAKKLATVNVSSFKAPQFKTPTGESEQILSTRAGVNNVRAYQLAKIGPTISKTEREQAIIDISPAIQSSEILSKSQNTSAFKAGESLMNSTSGSNNMDPGASQEFLRVNAEPRDPLNSTTGCGGRCTPPDIQVAAGNNQVIQMVNTAGKIWTNGNNNIQYFALRDFFATGTDTISDPYVVFDPTDQRWFASIFDVSSESYRIAVSNTDDATGGWTVYDLPFVSCPDQGRFAVSQDLFVISVNDFAKGCVDGFQGTQHAIINKHDMISAANNIRLQITPPDVSQFSVLPVHPLGSPKMFMASVDGFSTTAAKIIEITGLPPNATQSSFAVPIQQTETPPQAVQPGQTSLDTGDGRILSAAYRNGEIWIGFNDRCYNERSCVRLVDIDVDNGAALQDFNIGSRTADVFYPSLSVDNSGNMIVAFSVSSSSIFPSVMATGQSPNHDINTVAPPVYLAKGSASDTSTRYGDYTGAAIDSESNVWISSEFNKSPQGWSTHIASLSHVPGS
jgi:hypothetical protein